MRFFAGIASALALSSAVVQARINTTVVNNIISAIEKATTCAACHELVIPAMKLLAELGDNAFSDGFTHICEVLKLSDNDVCAGEFALSGPILAHSFRAIDTQGRTAQSFCSLIFGLCKPPAVVPYTVPFPKPAPTNQKTFVSQGKPPLQVVHYSDVHVDRNYTTGSNANCTKPICCRQYADSPSVVTDPAGPFGNNKCDTPTDLADSMLHAIGSLAPNASFAILTGDVVAHDIWLVDQGEATVDIHEWNVNMTNELSIPVFPSLGNHDSAPVNSFPRNISATKANVNWLFSLESNDWQHWIGDAAAEQIRDDSGSYAVKVAGTDLTIISINTMYWYKDNFWLYDDNTPIADPNNVLAFIVQQLQAVEDAGGRAWLIGHIPPGLTDFFRDQSNYYNQIVQRYHNTIAGQFFGHTHIDQFQIAYSNFSDQRVETANGFIWIAPSLTPTSGHPAFRVYDIDPDTYEVMDSHTFIANMSVPQFQESPTWELYYSARSTYGPLLAKPPGPTDALNGPFWHAVTEVFAANTSAFNDYFARQSRGFDVQPCDDTCRANTICDLRAARAENNCDVLKPGVNFKRSEGAIGMREDKHECESAVSGILRRMIGAKLDT